MKRANQSGFSAAALLLVAFALPSFGDGAVFERAEEAYQRTDYVAAIELLLPYSPKNASVYALLGKAYYMNREYKPATTYLEQAIAASPRNSTYFDWLGKSYGRRAEESSFLTALPLAMKTRECFEKAVAVGPTNLEALDDLFEFYLEAPGVVGGGIDKAQAVAARIAQLSEAESHYVRARLAQKRKQVQETEKEYRLAMNAAPGDVGRVIDLASFLDHEKRYQESDALFELATRQNPRSPKVIFAEASAYIYGRRNLRQAETLLRQYAEQPRTPDDPAMWEVARLMKKLRAPDAAFERSRMGD